MDTNGHEILMIYPPQEADGTIEFLVTKTWEIFESFLNYRRILRADVSQPSVPES
jgi:hypothetical protein